MPILNRLLPVCSSFVLSILSLGASSHAEPLPPALLRERLQIIARHQLDKYGAVRDGDYRPVHTINEAAISKQPTGLGWNYSWGVTLYGVMRATDVTGDEAMARWVVDHNRALARYFGWLAPLEDRLGGSPEWRHYIRGDIAAAGLLRLGNLDNCGAMGAQFLESLIRFPDAAGAEERLVVDRIANWIINRQARQPDGTFWRPTMTDEDRVWPDGTIWADDLYMSCPFLVRYAEFTGREELYSDAAKQILNMARRLQDADGVWFHGYSVQRQEHSPFKWGRANGWAMIAAVEVLSAIPKEHPARSALLEAFRRHADGVRVLQAETGLWHQILDHPTSWEETSCSAMFAYCFARGVRHGWLPDEYRICAERAYAAVLRDKVTPEGVVNGTSEGTGISLNIQYYLDRRRPDDDLHGRGAVLLAGAELSQTK